MIIERRAISEDDVLGDSTWIIYDDAYYKVLGVEANGFLELHNGELLDPDEDFIVEDEEEIAFKIIEKASDMRELHKALGYYDYDEFVRDNEEWLFEVAYEYAIKRLEFWKDDIRRILEVYIENTS